MAVIDTRSWRPSQRAMRTLDEADASASTGPRKRSRILQAVTVVPGLYQLVHVKQEDQDAGYVCSLAFRDASAQSVPCATYLAPSFRSRQSLLSRTSRQRREKACLGRA